MAQDTAEAAMPDLLSASYSDCRQLEKSFKKQEATSTSSHRKTAHKIAHQGDQFCRLARYPKGVALLERAIRQLQQP